MTVNDPFARLPEVATFTVAGRTVTDGAAWPAEHLSAALPGGKDLSPQLSWSGAPEGTKSYAVTVYDPDAPTGSGFWHWAVADIPATCTELPEGAGDDTGPGLPEGAFQLPNDARVARFLGAAPPAGHGPHRYFVVVHALDVESIGIPADATPAVLGFTMTSHTLARAVLVATAETPGPERIEASRLIPAPADAVFAVLTDPKGHVDIDASGTLMDAEGAPVTRPGDRFVVHMDREALGDVPLGRYDVEVVITKLIPGEEIAWTVEGRVPPHARHTFGYRLERAGDGTRVTSYYDWSEVDEEWRKRVDFPVVSEPAIKATLGILERTVRRNAAA
ncbi:YbhB/YbcL family Raf kinase inhibitor-like protein [Amycolatopsis sp. A133]|uniref:YbhB/YbcL family Raf kinase inhibitor-like protein n=1 Tax=Amycolatopsis sp. A133 TaxID=3064472 RepID=UPI0027F14E81|nr:YbhB/YbcL family Raf kinase inhibitor-like protein [Amycolatopsis sp. A133]MDQ7810982.1 YbhB/YbcL family Raf kinase inhibitor-like protein [Amycolatopsis sp. A133]